ncbi:uncharacterized protein CIMG_12595 [Coccidioides immitis RS]|uniref:Uncharacterized protein n=1 Tax=Coccidioides immitis (strain RS) TaxID=246410 RepID=A0A0D8JRL5_COCIM|nr:uncharacterized protein CIMG_12595 [Coccidioides immitis RS]KJF59932.1 hypothetical protein CIMG_12595 [Coccidioides immitis RS]
MSRPLGPVLSFSSAVLAPALAGNANLVILPGLLFYTEAQALSACERIWCCEPIQKSVLIAGLDNSNQLAVCTQLYESILVTRAGAQLLLEQKCFVWNKAQ